MVLCHWANPFWKSDESTGGERVSTDPICKMDVDPKVAKWRSSYKGKECYFCSPGCKTNFDKDPEKYA